MYHLGVEFHLLLAHPSKILPHKCRDLFLLLKQIKEYEKGLSLRKCATCQRILEELNWDEETQEIRSEKITEKQLNEMAVLAGSYEALFNRRAIKYKTMKLKEKILSESRLQTTYFRGRYFLKKTGLFD